MFSSKHQPMTFNSKEAADRYIFASHLDQFQAFARQSSPNQWIVVFKHVPSQEMAVLKADGRCSLLQ